MFNGRIGIETEVVDKGKDKRVFTRVKQQDKLCKKVTKCN